MTPPYVFAEHFPSLVHVTFWKVVAGFNDFKNTSEGEKNKELLWCEHMHDMSLHWAE